MLMFSLFTPGWTEMYMSREVNALLMQPCRSHYVCCSWTLAQVENWKQFLFQASTSYFSYLLRCLPFQTRED